MSFPSGIRTTFVSRFPWNFFFFLIREIIIEYKISKSQREIIKKNLLYFIKQNSLLIYLYIEYKICKNSMGIYIKKSLLGYFICLPLSYIKNPISATSMSHYIIS